MFCIIAIYLGDRVLVTKIEDSSLVPITFGKTFVILIMY